MPILCQHYHVDAWEHTVLTYCIPAHPHGGLETPIHFSASSQQCELVAWACPISTPAMSQCWHMEAWAHIFACMLCQGYIVAAWLCLFLHLPVPELLCRGLAIPALRPAQCSMPQCGAWACLSPACWIPVQPPCILDGLVQ